MKFSIFLFACGFSLNSWGAPQATQPDPSLTPGLLCNSTMPDFKGYDYPEHIARCNRNIQIQEKQEVAKKYGGIPQAQWPQYEFDHLIPLCAGGANDVSNLWPQPIAQAHQKDVLENTICLQMKAGTLKQADAVKKVHDWFASHVRLPQVRIAVAETPLQDKGFVCETADSVTIQFKMSDGQTMDSGEVKLVDADGEHEVVHIKKPVTGQFVHAKSPVLQGHLRFAFQENSSDRFELFLPNGFLAETEFDGYFKVGFEGSFPNLNLAKCRAAQ